MIPEWVAYNGTWSEFSEAELAQSGVQIVIAPDDSGTKEERTYLIGDLNKSGGRCSCCQPFFYDSIVLRYRVLVPPHA